jgi:hypothetical protein
MATLTPGEKARMYALGKIMRGGASRGGYVSSAVYITIDGVQVGWGATPSRVLLDSLTITDELDETPNTCGFRLNGLVPTAGSEVILTLGSKNRAGRLYAGFALTVQQLYVGDRPANVQADVRCVDYTWLFGFPTVTRQYRNQSATAIAADLVATYAARNGFTTGAVGPNLPVLDEITYTNEPLDAALTRLARRIGGYWFVDYLKVVHLFLEDTANAPAALTPTHPSLRAFQNSADRTQVLSRVYVEGRGSVVLATVAPGETRIPLAAVDMFAAGPEVFVKVSPQGSTGGAQHLSFTGVIPGGDGALVGAGAGSPSSAPDLTLAAGGAVTVGPHYYAYTWVSASGESLNSPAPSVTITSSGPVAVPPGVAVTVGTGLPPGTYTYGVTHVTATGETPVASSATAAVCTRFLGTSSVAPGLRAWPNLSTNLGAIGHQMEARLAYRSTTSLAPATLGPISGRVTLVASTTGQPSGLEVSFNLSLPTSANYLDVQVRNVTTGGAWGTVQTYSNVGGGGISAGCYVGVVTPTTAATETGGLDTAYVTVTVKAGAADVTARKVYRSKVGGGQQYFLRSVSGSAQTAFVDTAADSTLVTLPPAGAGTLQTVTVSGIARGPTGSGGGPATIARKLYRSTVDAVWKLLTTINDNTTTTYTDTLADASLGASGLPASDTSGLVADGGQVLAGTTAIPVSGTGAFPAAGGWVLSGNNRVRYAAVSGATLTGIPASGDGAIHTTIPYGTPITLAPMLTGVTGISAPLSAGDEIYLVVWRDDPARQDALSTMVHGFGIREEWVQDRRLSIGEAGARAQATLAQRPLEEVTITYQCRDLRTASGKTITVNLPPPTNVFGTFKIQSVTINNFRPHPTQYPTFTVTASSRRFNFEDWLRRMETSV